LLTGITYLLLTNPTALENLTEEVRSAFAADDEITLTSVGKLTYMLACLDEALRCYPPVPLGMPRVVPTGGATIAGEFVPENVSGPAAVALRHRVTY
jgi:cytochrome P450